MVAASVLGMEASMPDTAAGLVEPSTGSSAGSSAGDVLAFAWRRRADADLAERDVLASAATWADLHSADSIQDAATMVDRHAGDTGLLVAGEGAPLVAEFSVAEFAAAIGLPTEAGKRLIGHALELRHRLPRLWARVMAGDLPSWRARRVAEQTIDLAPAAAAFVDVHVAAVAHRIGPAATERLVDEARGRFMPEEVAARRDHAADGRRFVIDHQRQAFEGIAYVEGCLDLADALDLDTAIAHLAAELAALGSTDSLDVRRSLAAGELARRELALDLSSPEADPDGPESPVDPKSPARRTRRVVLYVHLSQAALGPAATGLEPARVENTGGPAISVEQVRAWCAHPDASVTVRPVLDLADQTSVTQYEIPDRMADQVRLRDQTCVFPWCTRPARACDLDHVVPHARGGSTAADNLAPLCRRHHRLKTHGRWRYRLIRPGTFLWASPHGLHFLRDHRGTLDVSTSPPDS